jgi:flagellin
MRINTNIASLNAQENSTNTNKSLSSSLEKLSSGLKINKAADDASGLAIADKLRTQASSLNQGISNATSASALIQIADKAMAEQSNILDTVKQKLIQASTSTTSTDGREAIRKDITKLLDQFDAIASQTNYNGVTLLQSSATDTAKADEFSFQLGEDKTFDVSMQSGYASNTAALGGGNTEFGATSINTSVDATDIFAANAVGAGGGVGTALYGNGSVRDNNIGVDGAQQINTSGEVTIATVDISMLGVNENGEKADTSYGIDITLSGDIGEFIVSGAGKMDISSETQEVRDAVAAVVAETAALNFNADGDISFATGATADFSGIEFSALNVDLSLAAGASIVVNHGGSVDDATFTVQNNHGQNMRDADATLDTDRGQLNVRSSDGTNAVRMETGALLSELTKLDTNELTASKANDFMETIDSALSQLNSVRSDFGSTQNQLESSIRNMQTTHTNLKNAEAVIRDTDFALESANFNKQNIIAQAGTYAMSQANAMAQNVQRLLQ